MTTYRFVTMTTGGVYGASYDVECDGPWWDAAGPAEERAEADGYDVLDVVDRRTGMAMSGPQSPGFPRQSDDERFVLVVGD